MDAVAPGAIGSRLHSGVVQPQEAITLARTSGSLPLFTISKVYVVGRPCGILPKLWTFSFRNNTSGAAAGAVAVPSVAAMAVVFSCARPIAAMAINPANINTFFIVCIQIQDK